MSKIDEVMDLIDRLGAPPVSKEEYLELLRDVASECAVRAEGVQAELADET